MITVGALRVKNGTFVRDILMHSNQGKSRFPSRRGDRLARLRGAVANGRALHLSDAAEMLGVSEMTIRRDLTVPDTSLAYYGGYIVGAGAGARYSLDQERGSHSDGKLAAARHAARLVEEEDTLFIDCGSTMPHLAASLPPDIRLTVVCYSLDIAGQVARRPNTQLVLLGGLYHASSETFFSEEALAMLRRVGINKAFLSAGGVHPERGASCSNFHEVPVKQAALRAAMRSYLVVDGSKFGRLKPAAFSPLDAFERIITDPSIDAAARDRFDRRGVYLDVAPE